LRLLLRARGEDSAQDSAKTALAPQATALPYGLGQRFSTVRPLYPLRCTLYAWPSWLELFVRKWGPVL